VPTWVEWFSKQDIRVHDLASGIDHLSVLDSTLLSMHRILTSTDKGTVWGWGFGQHGTFGLGQTSLKTSIVPMGLHNPFASARLRQVVGGMDTVVGIWDC
jgi:hypothetical protein